MNRASTDADNSVVFILTSLVLMCSFSRNLSALLPQETCQRVSRGFFIFCIVFGVLNSDDLLYGNRGGHQTARHYQTNLRLEFFDCVPSIVSMDKQRRVGE